MISFRISLLATALTVAAFAQSARAATAESQPAEVHAVADKAEAGGPAIAAQPGHQGQAFAAKRGAKALIVEPDGRVIATDGRSDLVAPAAIAERRTQEAIARLVNTAARGAPIRDKLGPS